MYTGGSLSLDAQKKSSDRTQVLYCLETGEESLNCVRVKVTFVQSSYKFTTSMVTVVTDEMTTEKLDAATDIGNVIYIDTYDREKTHETV